MEGIQQRATIEYDLKELSILHAERGILCLQIEIKSKRGINFIHPNQEDCGKRINMKFNKRSIVTCLVYGMTQTGKTGCMTSLIHHYILSHNIPINNIYIITGLSDTEWKKDTKNRLPDSINSRVYHRANLIKTFLKDIKGKKNVLIIMDEIQIACKDDQTIYNTFDKCGFYNLNFLLENDIKLVQFSATPDGNINDISDWGHHSEKIKLEPGEVYYGPTQAIEQNRVRQFKDLTNIDNVKELKNDIEGRFKNPRYFIFRVPNKRKNKDGTDNQSKVIINLKTVFGEENYEYNINYLKTQKDDINDELKLKPNKHTFIFICETYRCAKTLEKKFVGILYERYTAKPDDSTILQGLFGRNTGYNVNLDSICYTNISSVENYIKLWDNDMKFIKGIEWNTKTTQYDIIDDITSSTGTFNSVKNVDQLKDNCSEKINEDRCEPTIKIFRGEVGQNQMRKWFKENLKNKMPNKRGPNKKKINNGFYKGSIRKGLEILSTDEVNKEKRWGFGKEPGIRSYPCYSDVNDENTLEWWLIYYENDTYNIQNEKIELLSDK